MLRTRNSVIQIDASAVRVAAAAAADATNDSLLDAVVVDVVDDEIPTNAEKYWRTRHWWSIPQRHSFP